MSDEHWDDSHRGDHPPMAPTTTLASINLAVADDIDEAEMTDLNERSPGTVIEITAATSEHDERAPLEHTPGQTPSQTPGQTLQCGNVDKDMVLTVPAGPNGEPGDLFSVYSKEQLAILLTGGGAVSAVCSGRAVSACCPECPALGDPTYVCPAVVKYTLMSKRRTPRTLSQLAHSVFHRSQRSSVSGQPKSEEGTALKNGSPRASNSSEPSQNITPLSQLSIAEDGQNTLGTPSQDSPTRRETDTPMIKVTDTEEMPPARSHCHAVIVQAMERFLVHLSHHRLGPVFFVLFMSLIPGGLVALFYGGVDIGEPVSESLNDHLIYLLVLNPLISIVLSYGLIVVFIGTLDPRTPWRPFREWVWILFVNAAVQVVVLLPIMSNRNQSITLQGGLSMILIPTTTLFCLYFCRHFTWVCNENYFKRMHLWFCINILTVTIFVFVMYGYIFVFRELDATGQRFLSIVLVFVLFIFKAILLALGDPLPIEVQMIISGFWLESVEDVFQVLVFPVVEDPTGTFFLLAALRALEQMAYLFFLTEFWFHIRVWLKRLCIAWGHGEKMFDTSVKVVTMDNDPTDSGHSYQIPGYRRRQARFYMLKILSQISAFVFYIVISLSLRYGDNEILFPFVQEDNVDEQSAILAEVNLKTDVDNFDVYTDEQVRNSLIFAAVMIPFMTVTGYLGLLYIRRFYPGTYAEWVVIFRTTFVNVGLWTVLFSVMASNMMVAASALLIQSRIYYL
eukprot:Clim_evm9s36 gene=Clim_evmTU9s36